MCVRMCVYEVLFYDGRHDVLHFALYSSLQWNRAMMASSGCLPERVLTT